MPSMTFYRQAQLAAWAGNSVWASDNIVVTQHTASYTPNLDTDAYVSNLTNEVVTGNGYTQGGIALSGKSVTYTPANALASQWAPSTAYVVGQLVRPVSGNGVAYQCLIAGTSGSVQPTFTAYGTEVTDGSVTWLAAGAGVVQWNASNIFWPGYTATFRYLVVSDRQQGLATAQPLLGLCDMGGTVTGEGGSMDITWSPSVLSIVVP